MALYEIHVSNRYQQSGVIGPSHADGTHNMAQLALIAPRN